MPLRDYEESREPGAEVPGGAPRMFAEVEVLVTPAAPGEAPELATTGDPIFNRAWSALGTPVVVCPGRHRALGAAARRPDRGHAPAGARTLACAAWVEAALDGQSGSRPVTIDATRRA